MPALLKAKHEMVAQALAAGKTQRAAYQAAGYSYRPANAHRLCTDPAIEARVNEIAAHCYEDERRARIRQWPGGSTAPRQGSIRRTAKVYR